MGYYILRSLDEDEVFFVRVIFGGIFFYRRFALYGFKVYYKIECFFRYFGYDKLE